MKRLSAIILAVVMLLTVSACGDTVKYNKETGLVKEGKIIIGIDDQFPPMGFFKSQIVTIYFFDSLQFINMENVHWNITAKT